MQGIDKRASWSPAAHRGATYTLLTVLAVILWWLPPPAARLVRNQVQWAFQPGTRLIRWGAQRAHQLSQYVHGEAAEANVKRLPAHRPGP